MLKNASMSEVTPQASGQGAAQALGKVSTEKDTGPMCRGLTGSTTPRGTPWWGTIMMVTGHRKPDTSWASAWA